jgi:hypothetical protein
MDVRAANAGTIPAACLTNCLHTFPEVPPYTEFRTSVATRKRTKKTEGHLLTPARRFRLFERRRSLRRFTASRPHASAYTLRTSSVRLLVSRGSIVTPESEGMNLC